MEIHKEEQKIIDLYRKNILKEYTMRELMKALDKKSYNWTHKSVAKLGRSILIINKAGKTMVIKINLSSPRTIAYLSLLDMKNYSEKCPAEINDLLIEIVEKISKKSPYFTLLISGSYATGRQTHKSDLDLIIIISDIAAKKEIMPYIKDATRLSSIPVENHIFTKKEFIDMLIDDEENFGKEVFRKHLLVYGAEAYYQILKEAIRNGLQTKI